MILVIITALAAVCCADKLDKTYLPPPSAKTAGGSAGFLQTPFARSLEQGQKALPAGGFTNDFQGVVVDAANPGSRASGLEESGLGGPRFAYGSPDSKVGEAAFTAQSDDVVSSRIAPGFDSLVYASEEKKTGQAGEASLRLAPGFSYEGTEESQDFKSQGNTLKFNSDVSLNNYNYGFETANGIAAGQNGEAAGGVKAQGGYEYKGNDGQLYKVTYTADKEGFKPQGSHLPTPPPIPQEILVSLEQNAKDEAAGVVDDGSYDAQKYNDEGVYSGFNQDKQNSQAFAGNRGSGSFSNQNQAYNKPGSQFGSAGTYGSSSQTGFGNQQSTQFGGFKHSDIKPISKTENRFGSESSEGAFSSAFSSGSGVATAFAQAGSAPTDKGVNIAPSEATALAYGSDNQYNGQSVASADSQPSLSTSFASVQGSSGSAYSFASNDGLGNQDVNAPTSATASASVTPQPETGFGIKTQYGSNSESQFNHPGFSGFPNKPGHNVFGSSFGGSNYQFNNPGQFGFASQQNKFDFQGKPSGSFETTSPKPSLTQPQGPDSSYYYNQPSKPFATPVSPVGSKYSGLVSSPSKFPSAPISPTTASQTTSSSINGITQANISPFPSGTPTASTQFGSQSSQFGLKPSSSSGSSLSSEKYSHTTTFNKPLTQTGQNTFTQSTQAPIQEYQGTIYEYNKPAEILPTPSPKKPVKSESGAQHSGVLSQSGSQSSLTSSNTGSSIQSAQNSYNTQSQFGQKPLISSGSKFPQTQFTSQFGQKPFGSSQISNFNSQQTQFGSSSAFNQKPQNTYGTSATFGSQSSQFEQKPTIQQTQFGSLAGSQFNVKPQKEQTTTFGQTFSSSEKGNTFQTGTGSVSQFDKKPGTGQVSSTSTSEGQTVQTTQSGTVQNAQDSTSTLTTSTQKEQNFQYTQKPFGSTQDFKQTQFGSSFGSQFGQKPFVTSQTGLYKPQTQFGTLSTFGQKQQTSQFGQAPFGSSIGSTFQQTQFGSQFNQKPVLSQGSSFSSGTKGQAIQTSQFPVKPQTGFVFQQTQTGSATGSLLSQTQQNTQSVSSTVETQKVQNTQFGSQYDKKPETNQGSSFGSGTYSGGSAIQTTQFPLKPQSGESASQLNQYGSSTDLQSQKPQFGSGVSTLTTTQKEESIQTVQKPSTTFQQNQASSTFGSQFGQKPFGNSQTGSYFQKPAVAFGQKPTTNFASGSQSQFGQKPFAGSYFQQGQYGSQFAQKPQTGNVQFQQTQFGSQIAEKPQENQGSSFTGLTGQKVQTSQLTQQNQVISTTESQFALKPQYSHEQTSQFGQKPFGSSQTFSGQSSQYGSSFGQKQPQLSQQAQKPFSATSSTFGQSQFGSSVSKFEQIPQKNQESGLTTNTAEKDQTIQFGQKPVQQVDSGFQQTQFTTSKLDQKPFVSTQTESEYKQTEFASQSGSQFEQKPQSAQGSAFGFGSQSQFGQQAFGSQNKGSIFQTNQFGTTSGNKLSSPSKGQTFTTSQSDNRPSGLQLTQGSTFPSNSQSESFPSTQKPFGTQNVGSNFQQNQFGSSTFSTTTTSKPQSAIPQQQFGSQSTGSGSQTGQVGSVFTSQFPYTTTKPQFAYKPFGNTQGSYQQTQFGSNSGSYFAQKPTSTGLSTGSAFGSQTAQGSTYGSQTQKEFGSQTNIQQSQFGSQFNQPQSNQANAFASNSGFYNPQFNGQYKPFGSSFNNQGSKYSFSTLKPFNTQTAFGSQVQQSQFGSNEQKPSLAISGTGSQTEVSQSVNEKTQLSQNAGSSVQSTSSPVGFTGKPQYVYGGYSYQKPQTSFGITSRPDQNQQPTQSTAFATSSPAPFGVSTTESTSYKESHTVSQFGTQSGVGTNENSYGSTSRPQFGASPVSSTASSYVQPTQAPVFGSQTYKPFGASQGSVQKPFGSSFGVQTQTSQFNEGTKNKFGQFSKPVSTTAAPGFQGGVETSVDDVEGRPKEEFGGPRDPPKFDDKTGYHY